MLEAYRAGEKAFKDAIAIPDPAYPALEATMTEPLLHMVRSNLVADRAQGVVGRGAITLLHPHVDSIRGATAIVLDCEYSALVLVDAVGGQPGVTKPEYDGIRSTLVMVSPGGWKVSDKEVRLGECSPGY